MIRTSHRSCSMPSLGDSFDGMAASGQSMTLIPNTTSGLPVSVPSSLVIADRLVLNVAPRSNDGRSAPSDRISTVMCVQ